MLYVAGSIRDIDRVRDVMDLLGASRITFDWTRADSLTRHDLANKCVEGVFDAAAVVHIDAPRKESGRGSLIEVGFALAHNIPVIRYDPKWSSAFWELDEVHIASNIYETVSILNAYAPDWRKKNGDV